MTAHLGGRINGAAPLEHIMNTLNVQILNPNPDKAPAQRDASPQADRKNALVDRALEGGAYRAFRQVSWQHDEEPPEFYEHDAALMILSRYCA
jgi:hypothetical protein